MSKSQDKRLTVQRRDGIDPLKPASSLLCKLGSIVVHAEEALSPSAHEVDFIALRGLLADPEVKSWIQAMGPYVPVKR